MGVLDLEAAAAVTEAAAASRGAATAAAAPVIRQAAAADTAGRVRVRHWQIGLLVKAQKVRQLKLAKNSLK